MRGDAVIWQGGEALAAAYGAQSLRALPHSIRIGRWVAGAGPPQGKDFAQRPRSSVLTLSPANSIRKTGYS